MKEWIARLGAGAFRRNVAIVMGGTGIGQLLALAASPFLTRLYSPDDWGVLAVFTSLLSFLYIGGAFRYELAIPLPEKAKDAVALTLLSLGLVTATAAVSMGVVLYWGDGLTAVTHTEALRPWLWILPIGALWTGWNKVLTYWAIRAEAFSIIARTKVSQGVGQVVTKVGLGVIGFAPAGLLVGDVVGRAAGTGSLGLFAIKGIRKELPSVRLPAVWKVAGRYRRFPLISTGSGLLNIAGLRLPALLLAGFFGPAVAGWYGLCQAVAAGPVALLGQPISQVFAGTLAEVVRNESGNPERLFLRTLGKLSLIALVPSLLLGLLGPRIFGLAFGDQWHEAGVYVAILAPLLFAQAVAFPLSLTLTILERQGMQFWWDFGRAVVVVASLWIPFHYGWAPRMAMAAYSATSTAAYAALMIMSYAALRRRNGSKSDA